MSNDIIHKCCLCENDFRPGALDKEGKCASCSKAYPNVKTRKEMLLLNRPEIHLGRRLDEPTVRQIIKEELNEFKSTLKAEQKADNLAKARVAKGDKKNDENNGDDK